MPIKYLIQVGQANATENRVLTHCRKTSSCWDLWSRQCIYFVHTMGYINPLWPSDPIWQPRSGSTLAQVMACCLTAPSHYLNQCWPIINKVQWHPSECNFRKKNSDVNYCNNFGIYYLNYHLNIPRNSGFDVTRGKCRRYWSIRNVLSCIPPCMFS